MTVIQITLSALARKGIEDELRRAAADIAKGFETGGWIWVEQDVPWWRTEGVTIEYASGPGRRARRAVGGTDLDTGDLEDTDELLRRKQGWEVAGAWHLHPSGDDQPSPADEKRIDVMLMRREEWGTRMARVMELILTPRAGNKWTIHPWIYHRTKKPGIALPAGIPGPAEAAVMRVVR